MNAYAVAINEVRETYDYYQIDPPEPYLPISVFAADTRAQAKYDALREFTSRMESGVFSDDWPSLRTRLLARNVRRPRGEYPGTDSIWGLIPRDWPIPEKATLP